MQKPERTTGITHAWMVIHGRGAKVTSKAVNTMTSRVVLGGRPMRRY